MATPKKGQPADAADLERRLRVCMQCRNTAARVVRKHLKAVCGDDMVVSHYVMRPMGKAATATLMRALGAENPHKPAVGGPESQHARNQRLREEWGPSDGDFRGAYKREVER